MSISNFISSSKAQSMLQSCKRLILFVICVCLEEDISRRKKQELVD